MLLRATLAALIAAAFLMDSVRPHASFVKPASRSYLWKVKKCPGIFANFDHMSLYCGGFSVHHNSVNNGRCGICGDEYSREVKDHEVGGRYATGYLAGFYSEGEVIDVQIKIVANHRGFMVFRLCPHNSRHTNPTAECFSKYPLTVNGVDRFPVGEGNRLEKMKVKLPNGVTCSCCVLQWTYVSGNNWGVGKQNSEFFLDRCRYNQPDLGCGPQETFRGCSDICIGDCPTDGRRGCARCVEGGSYNSTTLRPTTTTKKATTTTTPTPPTTTTKATTTTTTSTTTTKTTSTTTASTTTTTRQPNTGKICLTPSVKGLANNLGLLRTKPKLHILCFKGCYKKTRRRCYRSLNFRRLCDCNTGYLVYPWFTSQALPSKFLP